MTKSLIYSKDSCGCIHCFVIYDVCIASSCSYTCICHIVKNFGGLLPIWRENIDGLSIYIEENQGYYENAYLEVILN